MAAWVTEYAGFAVGSNRGTNPMVPQEPAIATTMVSSGGSSGTPTTIQFSARTNLVVISASANFFGMFGSSVFSSTSGSTISSTGAVAFLGGTTQFRGVNPNSKMLSFST